MQPITGNQQLLCTISSFINSIGIPCQEAVMDKPTFLPGVDIVNGGIVYDANQLLSPGDLLHEAGHIAVLTATDRQNVSSPDVNGDLEAGGAEMAAIAWSWAALCHLQINPAIVFHADGYADSSDSIIDNFSNRRYFGVSLLQWFGMTKEHAGTGEENEVIYPAMKKWLR